MNIVFRELRTAAELAPMPALESRVWGGHGELVAVNMLVATISEGGMAIGAFDGDRLVGSVYGFATHDPHVLHSHYLAVDPDYRGSGLGVALKHHQREWCLANGRTAMRWTFDPLQLGNAHLNLRSLGAIGAQYHVDLYGPMGGINGGLPSDRLVVEWNLVEPRFVGRSRSRFRSHRSPPTRSPQRPHLLCTPVSRSARPWCRCSPTVGRSPTPIVSNAPTPSAADQWLRCGRSGRTSSASCGKTLLTLAVSQSP